MEIWKKVEHQTIDALQKNLREVFKGKVKAAFLFGGKAKGYALKGDYAIMPFPFISESPMTYMIWENSLWT